MSEKLWKRVDKTEGCWNWTGPVNSSGYGSLMIDGHKAGAHRHSYEMAYGPFDRALCVLHHCDNPRCVRPDHLWLGTRSDNMMDCAAKGRNQGHYRWTKENNPNAGKPMPPEMRARVSKWKERPFRVKSPNGQIIEGMNLTKFCRDNNLNNGAMFSVIHGRVRIHKGYTQAPIQS